MPELPDSPDALPPYPGVPFPAQSAPPPAPGTPGAPPTAPVWSPPPPWEPAAASPTGPAPARGNRMLVGLAFGAGALVVAAGAFLLGHATAPGRSIAAADATTLNALSSATTAPTGMTCTGVGRGAVGTLKSVNGTTLTVTGPKGADVSVKTDSSTKITKVVAGSLHDVTVGATVAVRGNGSGAGGTIAADDVALLPAGVIGGPPMGRIQVPKPGGAVGGAAGGGGAAGPVRRVGLAVGTVQSVIPSGFTLSAGGTTITVTTTSSTVFAKTVSASVSDLVVGQPIAVGGTPNADGSITANAVAQSTLPGGLAKLPGLGFGFGFGFGPPGGRFGRFPLGPGGAPGGTAPAPSTTSPTTTP